MSEHPRKIYQNRYDVKINVFKNIVLFCNFKRQFFALSFLFVRLNTSHAALSKAPLADRRFADGVLF